MENALAAKLAEQGLSKADIETVKTQASSNKRSLVAAIELLNKLPEKKMLEIMSAYYRVQSINLAQTSLRSSVLSVLPARLAQTYRVVPVDKVGNNIIIATGNPKNLHAADRIRFSTGYNVKFILASEKAISVALHKYYSSKITFQSGAPSQQDADKKSEQEVYAIKTKLATYENKVIELVDKIITQCYQRGASDLHVEPYKNYVRIRIRVDGILIELLRTQIHMRNAMVSRIKILCSLDVAETRLPQDGNLTVKVDNDVIEFRVSTMPTVFGEKVVFRLLDSSALAVDMMDLGFEREDLNNFRDAVLKPWGLVLVTGPTGSGKTTTLYSALQTRDTATENILTVEDPVEYTIDGVNQVQVKPKIGLDFARALRTFLRQDPDVIMLGEIRDIETANIAINAALTGHLVMSTLHTNSAYETITRLISMGVAAHYVVGALLCVVAQRLMRKLCQSCRQVDKVDPEFLMQIGIRQELASKITIYKEGGCKDCDGLGLKGRVAIHEVLSMSEPLYNAIIRGENSNALRKVGIETGMHTLRQAAILKMINGIVPISEVLRVTTDE
ncbi:MAG: ATPase, T2SS/T4P/T4SS family [Pseudomonadota bacterium]|nr:ATPase, T2SS/T4P/T4SS family [Pseudomonadota bacterium]